MKFGICRMFSVVAAVALVLAAWNPADVQAQSSPLQVRIPFAFHVGTKQLPAGTYLVLRSGDAIRIDDQRGNAAMVLTTAVWNPSKKGNSQLIFNQYEDHYFLSQVRWSEYSEARGLNKSKAETEIARTLGAPQQVNTASIPIAR